MDNIHVGALFGVLAGLILVSGFFSGSETGLMALNRYRLRHLAQSGNKGAVRAAALLERPDRLIGVILLGNNAANILASSIATLIGQRMYGEYGVLLAASLLTAVVLIFAEVTPKTLAALYPERVAFPCSVLLRPMLAALYPVVWVINAIANGLLRRVGVRPEEAEELPLSREELRTIVKEAGAMIPRRHQHMLMSILDLEKVTVDDIMIPRNEIVGIDLEGTASTLEDQLLNSRHTRMPVYRGSIDNVVGMLHARKVPRFIEDSEEVTPQALEAIVTEPYYVPLGTPLHTQLANFQRRKRRTGLVVDEYGDIQGLVTLEDILEEIVGEFTTDPQTFSKDINPQADGTFLIDGSASIRELNRTLHWKLPTKGPKTLNGLILEHLESIPDPGTTLRVKGHTIEIVQMTGQTVKTARVTPAPGAARRPPGEDNTNRRGG